MDVVLIIAIVVLYLVELYSSVRRVFRAVNYVNDDILGLGSMLFLFFFYVLLYDDLVIKVLFSAALFIKAVAFLVRVRRKKAVYSLYNVKPAIAQSIYERIEAYTSEHELGESSALFSNSRPYRLTFTGVSREDRRALLRAVNEVIAEGKALTVGSIAELALTFAMGGVVAFALIRHFSSLLIIL